MTYERYQMIYNDYKWHAKAAHDNPYYTNGLDYSEINKSEGYEVLYFLNHIGLKYWGNQINIAAYNKMERILREFVPARSTHKKAEYFIVSNWSNY